MGIIDIFFRKVDFGVMMENLLDGIYVFDVIYKVFVEVNEESMEVVVIIVVMMELYCMLLELKVFKVDYFFFFFDERKFDWNCIVYWLFFEIN